jgi:predicted glycosyltransferase
LTGPIGYYVHHHGDGHRRRAIRIASQDPGRFVLIGTGLAGRAQGLTVIDLPDDRASEGFDGRDGSASRPRSLHYAPLHHAGVRRRAAMIADWIARAAPALMVVDVSVEIAMLSRLCATPTVCVRLGGVRNDPAHLEAFRGATALLSPWHMDLDSPETPDWVRQKTRYVAGLTASPATDAPRPDTVLVIRGGGGGQGHGEALAMAARSTPDLAWRAMGPFSPPADPPANLAVLGWVEDTQAEIAAAGVVVGSAGDGVVSAVLAAGRPFVVLPEPRPFDEQGSKAARLDELGAAVGLDRWPAPDAWPAILARARALRRQDQTRLHDPGGPARAAAILSQIADDA